MLTTVGLGKTQLVSQQEGLTILLQGLGHRLVERVDGHGEE